MNEKITVLAALLTSQISHTTDWFLCLVIYTNILTYHFSYCLGISDLIFSKAKGAWSSFKNNTIPFWLNNASTSSMLFRCRIPVTNERISALFCSGTWILIFASPELYKFSFGKFWNILLVTSVSSAKTTKESPNLKNSELENSDRTIQYVIIVLIILQSTNLWFQSDKKLAISSWTDWSCPLRLRVIPF